MTTDDFSDLSETKNYETILINEDPISAVKVLKNNKYDTLLVLDTKNHLLGVLTPKNAFKMGLKKFSLKKSLEKIPLIRKPDIFKFAEVYINYNILLMPTVMANETLQSVYSIYTIARKLLFGEEFEHNEVVTECDFAFEASESVETILGMAQKGVSNIFPILQSDNLMGYVKDSKMLDFINFKNRGSRGDRSGEKVKFSGKIEDLVENFDVSILKSDYYHAEELIDKMEKSQTNTLIITDSNGNISGSISLNKMFEFILNSMEKTDENIQISVLSAPDENIEDIARRKISGLIERNIKYFGATAEADSTIKFHEIESQSQRGMFKYETEIRVSFGKGKDSIFSVETSDWGAEKSLNKAFNKISRILSDKRKIVTDSFHKRN